MPLKISLKSLNVWTSSVAHQDMHHIRLNPLPQRALFNPNLWLFAACPLSIYLTVISPLSYQL